VSLLVWSGLMSVVVVNCVCHMWYALHHARHRRVGRGTCRRARIEDRTAGKRGMFTSAASHSQLKSLGEVGRETCTRLSLFMSRAWSLLCAAASAGPSRQDPASSSRVRYDPSALLWCTSIY
jgi:hypothetical protein